MITITMPIWFAVSLTIYLGLDIIAKILNEVENKQNRDYRQHMKEYTEEERKRRLIEEWEKRQKER